MANHNDLGFEGEQIAVEHIKKKGYAILQRNYRYSHLELDIIAEFENQLVIVEVKTRQSSYLTNPTELLSKKKQRDLIKAANKYIEENEVDLDCRFDLIIVVHNKDRSSVEHIEDAFFPLA